VSKSIRAAITLACILLLPLAFSQRDIAVVHAARSTMATQAAPTPTPPATPLRAGLRASNYGISPFPSSTWWVNSINSMASRFRGSTGEQVAVVVEVLGGGGKGGCWAHFPQPAGTWPNVTFDTTDLFESTLAAFDTVGINVWLQVEPARCDVPILIDLLTLQYGHHASVIGFGVDVEWYRKDLSRYGKPVTDAEAQDWVTRTRGYNSGYQVFLKHWLSEKMPPTYRDGLVFIDDSQGHGSLDNMVNEFAAWGLAFPSSPVGFQYGYKSDQRWWKKLADPPKAIGDALLARIPNAQDLLWVDFTAYVIWPPE
jgi:hypothetical protein